MTGQSTSLATNGMVATPHYLASAAGLRVLQSGGNAVDAAIAANVVLNVVYPHMCSVGGDAFALVWDPDSETLHAINGSGRSPVAASIDALRARDLNAMPERGAHAVTVPGAVATWSSLLSRFGRCNFGDMLSPAIDYADKGFPVSPALSAAITGSAALLSRQQAASRQFLPGGRPPRPGQVLRQPDLAKSLRVIAEQGPSSVYEGAIGEAIVRTIQAGGGLMESADLASHRSDWVEPLSTDYRGVTLVEMPPNTQGVTALQMANIAEGFDIASMGRCTAAQIHHLVEGKKLAFRDRDRYITDPAFSDIPVDRLISKSYAADLRREIDPRRASNDPPDGVGGGDTIYLCVIDGEGRCVSLIQSLFQGFGSGLVADGAGIVPQNRGASFTLDGKAANRLEPGKRPMHTLIPGMLLRDGRPWVVMGTMGGHGQAQTHMQLLSNVVDFGLEPQPAIDAPRWVSGRGVPGDSPHVLYVEANAGDDVIQQLQEMGHDARSCEPLSSLMGHAQMIRIDAEEGVLAGAADLRADGAALGW